MNKFVTSRPEPVKPQGYQEYPRLLYGLGGARLKVNSDEERDKALNSGWSLRQEDVGMPAAEKSLKPKKGK